jgi:SAM-dependent methyltransferase
MGEVFLWRGTPEQRANRSLSAKGDRFSYFDWQLGHPDWEGKVVLDFGGNEGNLLMDRHCAIRPETYYCVDVLAEALEEGRRRFPQAHWVHYNRYNQSFNPEGVKDLSIPDLGTEFDFIVAYSVFTHTTREEMRDMVEQLRSRLAPGGTLAFTFMDPHYVPLLTAGKETNLRWRLAKANRGKSAAAINEVLAQSRGAEWCALVDGTEVYVNNNGVWPDGTQACMNYDVFYSVGFLRREFPDAMLRPPIIGHRQHCCLIRR